MEDDQITYKIQGNLLRITDKAQMANALYLFEIGNATWELSSKCDVWIYKEEEILRLMKIANSWINDLLTEED